MPDPAPNPTPNPAPSPAQNDPERRGPQIVRHSKRPESYIDRMVLKHGSMNAALKAMAIKNIKLDEANAALTAENEGLKPFAAKDAVILTGDDKKKWDAVKAIPLAGDKIAERIKKADELETKDTATERAKKIGEIAATANMNGDVLTPLLTQFSLDVEARPVTIVKDGKSETKQVAHIRKAGDANAAWEPLADFIAKDGSPLKPFQASLAKTGTSGTPGTSGTTGTPGITFPEQTGSRPTDGQGGSAVDKLLARNAERAKQQNPLTGASHATGSVIGGVPSHGLGGQQGTQGSQDKPDQNRKAG